MKTLAEIYEKYKHDASYGDKGTIHTYIEVYEEIFRPYRETAKRVLEIGILSGDSLRMWEEYFTTDQVHGVDLNDKPVGGMCDLAPMIAEGTHLISLFDATNAGEVERHFSGLVFDVVIDDGSHAFSHQIASYNIFRSRMAPNGIYVIEDIEDIDATRAAFEALDPAKRTRILDRRHLKDRFDDVLVIIGDKP